jgi:predicted metalloprotease
MARTRKTQDKDVIARIADSGEDALRRLVDLPRRIVVQAVDDVDERLHDLAAKAREIDPLHRRVAAIEKRLDALEKSKKGTGRTARRVKPATAHSASAPSPAEPEQAGHEPSRRDESPTGSQRE